MAALRSRCGHSILQLWFLSFSSPILSGCRLDVYHTSTHDLHGLSANLECRSEMYCKRLAEIQNTERKNYAKNSRLRTIA